MGIPVNEPLISTESRMNVLKCLRTGWISSSGPFVHEFEAAFAKKLGVKYAVATSSGTGALHVALLALGIGRGDEVIVPAFTMAASWMAVLYTGATPVFVDCELETYNIDTTKIESAITKRTRAIMPVHLYGHPCDMDGILRIARKYNIATVEDAAEAYGARYKGRLAGAMGTVGCFSFYANKIITTGEGGMIATDNENLADRSRRLMDMAHTEKRFIHDGIGYNYRISNLQAAMGCGELRHLDEYVAKKRGMALLYDSLLRSVPGIITPREKTWAQSVYWMYAVLLDHKKFGKDRDELRVELKKRGIETRDFFYPPEQQPVLKKIIGKARFPNAKYISQNGLYLPSGLALKKRDIRYVSRQIALIARYGYRK